MCKEGVIFYTPALLTLLLWTCFKGFRRRKEVIGVSASNPIIGLSLAILAMGIVIAGFAGLVRGRAGVQAALAAEWRLARLVIGGIISLIGRALVAVGEFVKG